MTTDLERYTRLSDLVQSRLPRASARDLLVVCAGLLLLAAIVVPGGMLEGRLRNAWAESHGATKLARPTTEECAITRVLAASLHRSGDDAALLRRVGGAKFSLDTFAWDRRPSGAGGVDQSGDWRWCSGFGPFVRGLGWVRLGEVASEHPTFYISRPQLDRSGARASVIELFVPSTDGDLGPSEWRAKAAAWNTVLARDPVTSRWTIIGRSATN